MASSKDTSPLPDPHILASGAKLNQIHPKPLLAHILTGMSKMELIHSQFGPVPRGSPISYHYPLTAADVPVIDFPNLPVPDYSQNVLSGQKYVNQESLQAGSGKFVMWLGNQLASH
ncbi:hypothetical protein QQF64_018455 [Cirrhinus molitorella]|uniref:Uncharacterized protein n=1 Tax=Cirrhinus molitorella TaxID=172907 RepID=A0ABR3LG39_9TELE